MTERSAIRRQLRQQRRALNRHQRLAAASTLATRLSGNRWFRAARHIAAYLAADGEIDPQPLIERAWSMNKRVYLPVLLPVGTNRLWFAPYEPGTLVAANRFGILEPVNAARTRVHPLRLDIALTPLVAFDNTGNRLGMGGGFYDRTFHYLLRHRHWRRPHLIGLAYAFQQVDELPHADWDVPLSGIATDRKILSFRD